MRLTTVLLALPLLAAPGLALAQGLDCRFPGTDTEAAICASDRLIALQNLAAGAFQDAGQRLGLPAARSIAREQLARRDACGANAPCIEQSLIGAVDAFQAASAPLARPLDPPLDPLAGPLGGGPLDGGIVTSPLDGGALPLGPLASVEDVPVGPDGALILPVVAAAPSGWLGDLSPEARLALGPPQMVAGPGRLLRPPPPMEEAFRDLPAEVRREVQAQLAQAGFGGAPDGVWGPLTRGALEAAASTAAAQGRPFDTGTREGAQFFLAYVASPDFLLDQGG